MKKLFLMIATVAALFATSCVTDTASDVQVAGGEVDVTLSVKAPGATSRTIADGLKAVDLTCGVYDADWKYLTTVLGDFDGASTTTTISMRLVKGKEYNFVFWAQAEGAPYELSLGTVGEVSEPTVTAKYANGVVANNDSLDAFYGRWACTVGGTINHTVELTRPFAQINFGTIDHLEAKEFGFDVVEDATATTEVTVTTFTSLSLKSDKVLGDPTEVTFAAAALPEDKTLVTNNGNYHWLAMNYILVPDEEISLAQCDLTVKAQGQEIEVKVPMAPAKRNWRTNLVGSLLTEQGNFTIQIDPILEQSDEYLGVVEVGTEEEFNAAFADPAVDFIVLTSDVTLITPVSRTTTALLTISEGKALTIDLNGKTLSAATAQLFDVLGELVIKNGTIENTAENGVVFAADVQGVTVTNTTVTTKTDTKTESLYYDAEGKEHTIVSTWAEFTAALAALDAALDVDKKVEIMLGADITYDANYQLQKLQNAVVIDLNSKSMTLPMINIHIATTVKNGTINGKVYARKNSEVVFDNVKFSGAVSDNLSTEGHLAIQGGCKSLYAKDCLFSPTSVSGSQTKPLSFEGGASTLKFENCEFKSSPYKKQVYLNSLGAAGSLEFINCNFNNKTPNIMFAAACPLTNITMSGTTKLSNVTFEINRAKDAVTEAEWAHIKTLIANNSYSSVRIFYAGGSSESIR